MKKILLMVAVAASLLMGSSTFAQNANNGSAHGLNSQGQSPYQFFKVRRAAPRPTHHCHKKRVRARRGHHRGKGGHGHRRHHQKWKWVTYCHSHYKSRRGYRGNRSH